MRGPGSELLSRIAGEIERQLSAVAGAAARQVGAHEQIEIVPYRTFGTSERVFVMGRVLERSGIVRRPGESRWRNLLDTLRRVESDEIPGARVSVSVNELTRDLVADEEGYYHAWLAPTVPLTPDREWHPVAVELAAPLRPGHPPVTATGEVLVPTESASFGVISDIDDTVVRMDVEHIARLARTVMLGSARTRLPFDGVAGFYAALRSGRSGDDGNPLFYVSNSPWNLYDLLTEFFDLRSIPRGPILLRDWGLSRTGGAPTGELSHKASTIRTIMSLYDTMPFILIGDSGEKDPEIYTEVVRDFPSRVLAVYIRNVSRHPERIAAIQELAHEVLAAQSALVLADDTLAVAHHAAEHGYIRPDAVASVVAEKQRDEALPATDREDQVEAPTVVVEARAVAPQAPADE